MPPPDPRSRTVSPGFKLANAVGFPQPSEALTASSGSPAVSSASYRLEVIGSQQSARCGAAPQQELPPETTRKAAWPYFSFTTPLISTGISCFESRDIKLYNRVPARLD